MIEVAVEVADGDDPAREPVVVGQFRRPGRCRLARLVSHCYSAARLPARVPSVYQHQTHYYQYQPSLTI